MLFHMSLSASQTPLLTPLVLMVKLVIITITCGILEGSGEWETPRIRTQTAAAPKSGVARSGEAEMLSRLCELIITNENLGRLGHTKKKKKKNAL